MPPMAETSRTTTSTRRLDRSLCNHRRGAPLRTQARFVSCTGRTLAAAAVSWTEFLSKPIPQVRPSAMSAMPGARIIPFAKAEAELAAQLFQIAGVKRAQRLDTMTAATAILASAELAAANTSDFASFTSYGLKPLPLPMLCMTLCPIIEVVGGRPHNLRLNRSRTFPAFP